MDAVSRTAVARGTAERVCWSLYGLTIATTLVSGYYWFGGATMLLCVGLPFAVTSCSCFFWYRAVHDQTARSLSASQVAESRFLLLGKLLIPPALLVAVLTIAVSFKNTWLVWPCWLVSWLPVAMTCQAFFTDRRTFSPRLFCPSCGKFADAAQPWLCGFCSTENFDVVRHSFLLPCVKCAATPRHFQCPSCETLIPLSKPEADLTDTHFARSTGERVADPAPEPKPELTRKRELEEAEFRIRFTQKLVELAQTEQQLREAKEKAKPPKKQSSRDQYAKDLDSAVDQSTGLMAAVAAKQKLARENYPAGSPELQRELLAIEEFKRQKLLKE